MKRRSQILLLALILDWLTGDLPNRFHPVAWMGKVIAWGKRCCSFSAWWAQFAHGALLLGGGGGGVILLAQAMRRGVRSLPTIPGMLFEAWLLKQTFSVRGLLAATGDVQRALSRHDLPLARHWLRWHLVSREVGNLDESGVIAAAIESLAENASDGVIAPWWWYMVGGLPFAYFYRFVNTADAMLGYRDPRHEWLGKASARLDDLLNLIPARLTALLIILTTWRSDGRRAGAWRIWRRDAHRTESPNAGHPMSAMAGALGVRLEKEAHYVLGAELPPPQLAHLGQARGSLLGIVVMGSILTFLVVTFRPFKRSKQ